MIPQTFKANENWYVSPLHGQGTGVLKRGR
jgi:hypothetical protein